MTKKHQLLRGKMRSSVIQENFKLRLLIKSKQTAKVKQKRKHHSGIPIIPTPWEKKIGSNYQEVRKPWSKITVLDWRRELG